MSKFSLDVLEQRVFPYARAKDPDVILGAAFGEDVAVTRVGEDILVSHVDPIVGAIGDIGWLAVHVACNDVAASGIQPRWLQLLVLVPRMEDVELLERIMQDASRAAKEVGASIIGGHTGYSAGLSRPLVAVTALGTAPGEEPVLTGGARVGDSRFAEAFAFDPLRMISSGTLAVTVPPARVEAVSEALEEMGTPFAFVGHATEGTGVRVHKDGETAHHTEIRCEDDELARLWALYPRDE
jgi:hydrogenase maturation factor